ncbi:MAG: hypothetical protein K1W37_17045 [Lachnospiraceae bacterium]
MDKCLLLGNGINIHFGINELYLDKIAIRFKDVLVKSSPLYECLFGVSFSYFICDFLYSNAPNLGIETLSAEVYKYVYTHITDQITLNTEYRLQNAIKTSAINAIFYSSDQSISIPSLDQKTIDTLKKYQSIYTLNYTEFWDTDKLCTYLHGAYTPTTTSSNKDILLYSSEQYYLTNYRKVVDSLRDVFNMIDLSCQEIVFSPLIDKQEILKTGHYPSNKLYLANDLFPYTPPKLYSDLDYISSLDIFGMSPFGDDKLLDRLGKIPDLTIYVYQMNNYEMSAWNHKLKRNCCTDSSTFDS